MKNRSKEYQLFYNSPFVIDKNKCSSLLSFIKSLSCKDSKKQERVCSSKVRKRIFGFHFPKILYWKGYRIGITDYELNILFYRACGEIYNNNPFFKEFVNSKSDFTELCAFAKYNNPFIGILSSEDYAFILMMLHISHFNDEIKKTVLCLEGASVNCGNLLNFSYLLNKLIVNMLTHNMWEYNTSETSAIVAIIVQKNFGGKILKTKQENDYHYFNIINGKVIDLFVYPYYKNYKEINHNETITFDVDILKKKYEDEVSKMICLLQLQQTDSMLNGEGVFAYSDMYYDYYVLGGNSNKGRPLWKNIK